MRKGKELKTPRHASAAASRDDRLPHSRQKGIGVLKEIRLGSINKKELLKNKLPKGDLRKVVAKLLRSISFSIRRESILLLLSSYRPYFISFYSLKQTFL